MVPRTSRRRTHERKKKGMWDADIFTSPQDLVLIAKNFVPRGEVNAGEVGSAASTEEAQQALRELLEGERSFSLFFVLFYSPLLPLT